jgi:hypothetical protein
MPREDTFIRAFFPTTALRTYRLPRHVRLPPPSQSPSALFESYASDLSQLLQSITSQLEGTTPSGGQLVSLRS